MTSRAVNRARIVTMSRINRKYTRVFNGVLKIRSICRDLDRLLVNLTSMSEVDGSGVNVESIMPGMITKKFLVIYNVLYPIDTNYS